MTYIASSKDEMLKAKRFIHYDINLINNYLKYTFKICTYSYESES